MEINFKARQTAVTKNMFKSVATRIDLYELGANDKKFLEKLKSSVDFDKNLAQIPEFDRKRWQKVFNYTIESAKNPDNCAFVAISSSKPCGIISFWEDAKSLYLDAICDIPQNNGRRINFTGSTLFYQLFKIAEKLKVKCINLAAVIDGPFDVISKYKEKGFKETGSEGEYITMTCNKYKIKEQLEKLSSEIQYKPVINAPNRNLNDLIV